MKQFFKFVFASALGVIIASFVIIFCTVLLITGIVSSATGDKAITTEPNSLLVVEFKRPIEERTPQNPFAAFGFLGFDKPEIGLNDILANIKKAKTDDNIKGIFLNQSFISAGHATLEEIRNALIDFKRSGKFVVAYSEVYSQSFYYLASVADKVYMNPNGDFDFRGFSSEVMFLKGTLDKLGIEAQILKVGTYKSAVEPFILDKMSDANRLQMTSYVNSIYEHYLASISNSRKINKDSLFSYANNFSIQFPKDAVRYKLIDGLKYKDEIIAELKKRTGVADDDDLKGINISEYTHSSGSDDDNSSHNQIAMVYAVGEISGGEGSDNSIGSEGLSRTLRELRRDNKIKAVVLRVNSPGGSALASDVIWREVELTKKVKPIIVSMGDVAASGGYYIACAADSIFAEPNTITGSIGIFAVLPNMQKFLNDKLGVTFDGVKTGKYADLGDITRPLSADEQLLLQRQINNGYDVFTKVVATGRKKSQSYIDSIGQGRVWTGQQALKIGLVDKIGHIHDAVKAAAKKAKITNYELVAYPDMESKFKKISSTFSISIKNNLLRSELGDSYKYYDQINQLKNIMYIPQARLPFNITIK